MKAVRVHAFGGIGQMIYEEVPVPDPGPGQLLVRVAAAGVGPWDAWVRSGRSVLPQPLPLTLGADLSGTVEAVGPGVAGPSIGTRVFGTTNARFTGAYAEHALAEAAMVASTPRALTEVEAASVPVVACTALQMLFDRGGVRAGQIVVVLGGGGNVGGYAVQLAALVGANVIATGRARDLDRIRGLGACDALGADEQIPARFRGQADAVIDTVGGAALAEAFNWLRPGGILVSAVAEPDRETASRRDVRVEFILVAVTTEKLDRLGELFEQRQLRAHVGQELGLEDARTAHRLLENQDKPPGKIVLIP